jgi:hypothetical protein
MTASHEDVYGFLWVIGDEALQCTHFDVDHVRGVSVGEDRIMNLTLANIDCTRLAGERG